MGGDHVVAVVVEVRVNPLAQPFLSGSVRVEALHDVFAALTDGEGRVGIGYSTAFTAARGAFLRAALDHLRPAVLGSQPSQWARLSGVARRAHVHDDVGAGTLLETATGVLQLAAVDLLAQQEGRSVAQTLWGTAARARFYVSGGSLTDTADDLAAACAVAASTGAGVFKLKIDGTDPEAAASRVEAVLAGSPAGVRLAVDANQSFSVGGACRFLAALGAGAGRLAWLEEPVEATDFAALAELRARSPVALAAGETLFGRAWLERLVRSGAAQRIILNPARAGGVAAFVELGDEASRQGSMVAGHVFPHVTAQLLSPSWDGSLVEYLPWWDRYFAGDAWELSGGVLLARDGTLGFGYAPALRRSLRARRAAPDH